MTRRRRLASTDQAGRSSNFSTAAASQCQSAQVLVSQRPPIFSTRSHRVTTATKLTRLLLRVADPRDFPSAPEISRAVLEHLNRVLYADGFAIRIIDGKPLIARQPGGAIVNTFVEKPALLDFDTVQLDISRALASAKDDPEDAVTAACSLIESVCRSILIELKLPCRQRRISTASSAPFRNHSICRPGGWICPPKSRTTSVRCLAD